MWTTEDHWLHRLTNASSKHALVQVHERAQQNAREHRPLTGALAQVPRKTPLGVKKHWRRQMHWDMCITIPQTLMGTQTLFVVNCIKLHLTAFILSDSSWDWQFFVCYLNCPLNFTCTYLWRVFNVECLLIFISRDSLMCCPETLSYSNQFWTC